MKNEMVVGNMYIAVSFAVDGWPGLFLIGMGVAWTLMGLFAQD